MSEDSSVRDKLSKERTDLSNERTLLAYWRTGLAFFIAGAVLFRVDTTQEALIFSALLMLVGAGVFVFGIKRYYVIKSKTRSL